MDDRSFDRLARALGEARDRRTGLKALVGGILGAGGLAALDGGADARRKGKGKDDADRSGPDADRRKKKRKKCDPPCGDGFACVKGACSCATGIACAGTCCASGQVCRDGACSDRLPACLPAGEPCKNTGRRCCDGLACASGQGGDSDVACYVPKTGACERTADCVYGLRCRGGRCEPPQPGDLAEPCDATAQQLCDAPGAICTAYTGPGAPDGPHCTLPLRMVCTGDEECTCYRCWYLQEGVTPSGPGGQSRRDGRSSANRKGCCHVAGVECASEEDCCLGLSCNGGFCGASSDDGSGTVCVPDDATGCNAARCCSGTATCNNDVCKLGVPPGEACSTGAGSLPCLEGATCRVRPGGAATFCLKSDGASCAAGSGSITADDTCASTHCVTGTCRECVADQDCPFGMVCDTRNGEATRNSCVQCVTTANCTSPQVCKSGGTVCVACNQASDCADPGACKDRGCTGNACVPTNKANGTTCTITSANDGYCATGTCTAKVATGVQCPVANEAYPCSDGNATCTTYAGGTATTYCLLADTKTCSNHTDCVSGSCVGAVGSKTCRSKIATGSACTDQYDVCVNSDATCVGTAPGTCKIANTKTCAADADCASGVCAAETTGQTTVNVCRECASGKLANCTSASKVCDTRAGATLNTCVQCVSTADCTSPQVCKTGDVTCVACNQASDCGNTNPCKSVTCTSNACGTPTNVTNGTGCTITSAGDGYCSSGTCTAKIATGNTCAANSYECLSADASCVVPSSGGTTKYCLLPDTKACTADNQCVNGTCAGAVGSKTCRSKIATSSACADQYDVCVSADATCVVPASGGTTKYCLLPDTKTCTAGAQCASGVCDTRAGATQNTCVQCVDNTTCSGATPVCKTGDVTCVACNQASDCGNTNPCKSVTCTANACGTPTNVTNGTGCTITSAGDGYCSSGTCTAKIATGNTCTANAYECQSADATCTTPITGGATKKCLISDTKACTGDAQCASGRCTGNVCVPTVATGSACSTTGGSPVCYDADATCQTYTSQPAGSTYCLLPTTKTCTANNQCASQTCSGTAQTPGTCQAPSVSMNTRVKYAAQISSPDYNRYIAVNRGASGSANSYAWVTVQSANTQAGWVSAYNLGNNTLAKQGADWYGQNFSGNGGGQPALQMPVGIAVSSDGKLLVSETSAANFQDQGPVITRIFEVSTDVNSDLQPIGDYWFQLTPGEIVHPTDGQSVGSSNEGYSYAESESLHFEGSSTAGTAWLATKAVRISDCSSDCFGTIEDLSTLLKIDAATRSNPQNSVPYRGLCATNTSARMRQVTASGRSGDGNYLYLACSNSKVLVFDKTTGTVAKTIAVTGDPYGISFIGDVMYVTALSSNTIYPITISGNGSSLTTTEGVPRKYTTTTPYPTGLAYDSTDADCWMGSVSGGITVTNFEVCSDIACKGVCCPAGSTTCSGANGTCPAP